MFENPSKITSVIWDWNGTLLNDVDICVESINQLLADRNLPILSTESYRNVFDFPVKDYYQRIGFNFEHEPFEIPAHQFIDLYSAKLHKASLQLNATKALRFLKNKGIKQFVLSAAEEDKLNHALKYFGIAGFFDGVAGLNHHYAHSKLEVGHNLLEKNNINPLETIMVGDTLHDFDVAKQLGINCMLVANGHQSQHRLAALGVQVLSSLNELELIFKT